MYSRIDDDNDGRIDEDVFDNHQTRQEWQTNRSNRQWMDDYFMTTHSHIFLTNITTELKSPETYFTVLAKHDVFPTSLESSNSSGMDRTSKESHTAQVKNDITTISSSFSRHRTSGSSSTPTSVSINQEFSRVPVITEKNSKIMFETTSEYETESEISKPHSSVVVRNEDTGTTQSFSGVISTASKRGETTGFIIPKQSGPRVSNTVTLQDIVTATNRQGLVKNTGESTITSNVSEIHNKRMSTETGQIEITSETMYQHTTNETPRNPSYKNGETTENLFHRTDHMTHSMENSSSETSSLPYFVTNTSTLSNQSFGLVTKTQTNNISENIDTNPNKITSIIDDKMIIIPCSILAGVPLVCIAYICMKSNLCCMNKQKHTSKYRMEQTRSITKMRKIGISGRKVSIDCRDQSVYITSKC